MQLREDSLTAIVQKRRVCHLGGASCCSGAGRRTTGRWSGTPPCPRPPAGGPGRRCRLRGPGISGTVTPGHYQHSAPGSVCRWGGPGRPRGRAARGTPSRGARRTARTRCHTGTASACSDNPRLESLHDTWHVTREMAHVTHPRSTSPCRRCRAWRRPSRSWGRTAPRWPRSAAAAPAARTHGV